MLELEVVKAGLVHAAQVEVVDAQVLIRLHLSIHIFGVPGELQELFEAIGRFEVLFEQSVDVAKLLVSDHFVLKHVLFLTLMLESFEHVFRLLQVFKVHADHTVGLQRPIVTVELIFLLFFNQVTK